MQCPTCKQVLGDGVRFCPHDGTPLTDTGATAATRTAATAPAAEGGRPVAPPLPLPTTVGGRYRLEELRGGGGMARVYRATDTHLHRPVAVKLITPELRAEPEFDARFEREARIASGLADPHIVVVHDFGLDPAQGPYLVMEYLNGQSLRERLATGGPLPLKAAVQLAGQVLLALIHAHGKGVVHRDIKPDNIFLLNQSGVRLHVRMLDFGIARIYRSDDGQADTITHAGAVLGTPRYMSPEQLAGKPVDARSDLFSFALVVFEALTGQLPYAQGKRLGELCRDASPALQELLEACLRPDPADRPPSAVEVYLRMQELGKASGILLLPPGAMDRLIAARAAAAPTVTYTAADGPARTRTRRRLLIGSVAGLAVLAGAVWLWWQFFTDPTFPPGPETLLGVQVGDALDEVERRLPNLTRVDRGNPWQLERTRHLLGPVLRPEDLGLTDAELRDVTVRRSGDGTVCVLLSGDRVVAVVATHAGARTRRDVGVGSDLGRLYRRYDTSDDLRPQVETTDRAGGGHVEVRRYSTLGVSFEVAAGRVAAVALYPPRP
ncbi:MAG: protein kinase [Gemmataceae bacterium]